MQKWLAYCLIALLAIVASTLVIFLSPLKHLNLVDPSMNDIEPAAFWADYQKNPDEYVFVDVRTPQQYAAAHAKSAVNIPAAFLYDQHANLPRSGKKIALICGDGRLAAIAYGYLENLGFLNLVRIK